MPRYIEDIDILFWCCDISSKSYQYHIESGKLISKWHFFQHSRQRAVELLTIW